MKKELKNCLNDLEGTDVQRYQIVEENAEGIKAESFHEEEYYLYEDYECFAFLLNKTEAYALLEALENLEESEPADGNAD